MRRRSEPTVSALSDSKLIDRKRLMAEYGFTGSSADRIIRDRRVRTVKLPGERKVYIVRADVDAIVDEYTYAKDRVRAS